MYNRIFKTLRRMVHSDSNLRISYNRHGIALSGVGWLKDPEGRESGLFALGPDWQEVGLLVKIQENVNIEDVKYNGRWWARGWILY